MSDAEVESSPDDGESKSPNASMKKRRRLSQNSPTTTAAAANDATFDEDHCCSICFEPYTNNGRHRLTCLKCGHLFGRSCIKKWLSEKGASKRSCCPQCKARAKLTDLRNHYCKGVKVVDTSEKEEVQKSLKEERTKNRLMQIELATLRQRCDSLQNQLAETKQQIKKYKQPRKVVVDENSSIECCSGNTTTSRNACSVEQPNFPSALALKVDKEFFQRLEVSRDSDSRVMDFCAQYDLLVASARQTNALFHNFGLKKVDLFSLRCESFIPLHADVVRDVKICGTKALTASFDKTLVLSDLRENNVISRWKVGQRVWSCSHNTSDCNYIFAATQNGKIRVYDIRLVQSHFDSDQSISVQEICDLKKPIFNLHWIQNAPPVNSGRSGLLVSSIDQCIFYEYKSPSTFEPHYLPVEGRLYSVSYDDATGHFLISFGPSTSKRASVEHSVYELSHRANNTSETNNLSDYYTCDLIRSFNGGSEQSLMCRNYLTRHPKNESELLALTYSEADKAIHVWSASDGRMMTRLPVQNESIYDIRYFNALNHRYLALLNNKYLSLRYFE